MVKRLPKHPLKMTIQLLTRIVPQTYGGTQKDIDTAKGQEQAL
jgi:hypothetical protein